MEWLDLSFLQQMMHPALVALLSVVIFSLAAAMLVTGSTNLTKVAKKAGRKTKNIVRKTDWSTAVSASLFKLKKSDKASVDKQE